MKNSNETIKGNKVSKDQKSTDSVNLENLKIEIKKDSKIPLDKESVMARKNLYNGMEGMKEEEKKKFRSKIRRKLHSFCNSILGKDRSPEERKEQIAEFLKFYKTNWKIQNFKIEDFSQSKDLDDLRDYKNLLAFVQESIGK